MSLGHSSKEEAGRAIACAMFAWVRKGWNRKPYTLNPGRSVWELETTRARGPRFWKTNEVSQNEGYLSECL